MNNIKTLSTVLLTGLTLAACQNQPVQEPRERVVYKPVEKVVIKEKTCDVGKVINKNASFGVQIWADPGPHYIGQNLKLNLRPMSDAHVNLYAVTSSCKTYQLLENYQVKGGETVSYPTRESGINLRLKPPAGTETYVLVASRKPLDWLSSSDVLSNGAIKSLDLSAAQLYSRLNEVTSRINPHDWNSQSLALNIKE